MTERDGGRVVVGCRAAAVAALVAAASAAMPARAVDRMVTGFPDLPRDARSVAERTLGCRHFGGELDGTGGERDREVTRTMRRLRCDRVERDLDRIRSRYRDDARVTGILREADPEP